MRDGEIARGDGGKPVFVTGPTARAHGHLLRATHDAILVGAGTVRDDDPELTCRLPGLVDRSPVRVVLSRAPSICGRCQAMIASIACGARDDGLRRRRTGPQRARHCDARGVEVIAGPNGAGKLWLPAVMEALVARGITRLLVEGGPRMWRVVRRRLAGR